MDKYFICDVFVLNLHVVVNNICTVNFDMYEIYRFNSFDVNLNMK